MSIEILG